MGALQHRKGKSTVVCARVDITIVQVQPLADVTGVRCCGCPNVVRVAVVSVLVIPGGALALACTSVAPHRAWRVACVVVIVTKLQKYAFLQVVWFDNLNFIKRYLSFLRQNMNQIIFDPAFSSDFLRFEYSFFCQNYVNSDTLKESFNL